MDDKHQLLKGTFEESFIQNINGLPTLAINPEIIKIKLTPRMLSKPMKKDVNDFHQ